MSGNIYAASASRNGWLGESQSGRVRDIHGWVVEGFVIEMVVISVVRSESLVRVLRNGRHRWRVGRGDMGSGERWRCKGVSMEFEAIVLVPHENVRWLRFRHRLEPRHSFGFQSLSRRRRRQRDLLGHGYRRL